MKEIEEKEVRRFHLNGRLRGGGKRRSSLTVST